MDSGALTAPFYFFAFFTAPIMVTNNRYKKEEKVMKESMFTKILRTLLLVGQAILLVENLWDLKNRIRVKREKRKAEMEEAQVRVAKATLDLSEIIEKLDAKKVS